MSPHACYFEKIYILYIIYCAIYVYFDTMFISVYFILAFYLIFHDELFAMCKTFIN